jgi:hypothetical protein
MPSHCVYVYSHLLEMLGCVWCVMLMRLRVHCCTWQALDPWHFVVPGRALSPWNITSILLTQQRVVVLNFTDAMARCHMSHPWSFHMHIYVEEQFHRVCCRAVTILL